MASIEILDRASLLAGLHKELHLDAKETALVTIDMHRGHLDMDVATMPATPEDAKRVTRNARAALDFARAREIPVIHVILVYRKIKNIGSEGMLSPYWKAIHAQGEMDRLTPGRKSSVREHNVEGSPGTQIVPELYRVGDYVIDNKKRLDCFYGTDLRQLLDALSVKSVVLMGINTNTCVLNTAFTTPACSTPHSPRSISITAWSCCPSAWRACTATTCTCWGCRTSRAASAGS